VKTLSIAIVLAAASAGCFHAPRPTVLSIPLDVAASPDQLPVVHYSESLRLYVMPVADERSDKDHVGANKESDPAVPVVAAKTQPTDFVARIVSSELSSGGVKIASDPGGANRALRIRLQRFYTEETGTYASEVTAVAEVLDDKQQVVFSATVTGTGKQWGRSLNADNYDEVFSRATFDMAKNMLTQPDFQKALDVGGGGAPHGGASL
jgi:hypothetical protein